MWCGCGLQGTARGSFTTTACEKSRMQLANAHVCACTAEGRGPEATREYRGRVRRPSVRPCLPHPQIGIRDPAVLTAGSAWDTRLALPDSPDLWLKGSLRSGVVIAPGLWTGPRNTQTPKDCFLPTCSADQDPGQMTSVQAPRLTAYQRSLAIPEAGEGRVRGVRASKREGRKRTDGTPRLGKAARGRLQL